MMRCLLDEAEPARGLVVAVDAHDDAADVPSSTEQLKHLLFGGEERQVADVECGRLRQQLLLLSQRALNRFIVAKA